MSEQNKKETRRLKTANERFRLADRVIWLHCPPGGYGMIFPVDGRIVEIHSKLVSIEVKTKSGETKIVRVNPKNLELKK